MKSLNSAALIFVLTVSSSVCYACSMCKITANGKTIVGNNEDTWRTGSKIWFEQGNNGRYGAVYFGLNDGFPQGGMNESGLAFDGFAVYPRTLHPQPGKKKITNHTAFLKEILQRCATAQEVKTFVNQYDRSIFNHSMLLFVDKTGEYVVVEVDTVMLGDQPTYLLANFCPSQTRPEDVKFDRYLRGVSFLKNNSLKASSEYGTALMQAMHECRPRVGDGTAYTSIYDLQEGLVTLYFYHDYKHPRSFKLKDELAKPEHAWELTAMFPQNKEYAVFTSHLTPFNNHNIQGTMEIARRLLPAISVLYIFLIIRNTRNRTASKPGGKYVYTILAVTNIILSYFITLLLTNEPIYYFDFPYSFETTKIVDIMAYVPLALLIGFVPIAYGAIRLLRAGKLGKVSFGIVCFNLLIYLALLAGTWYWGIIGIF